MIRLFVSLYMQNYYDVKRVNCTGNTLGGFEFPFNTQGFRIRSNYVTRKKILSKRHESFVYEIRINNNVYIITFSVYDVFFTLNSARANYLCLPPIKFVELYRAYDYSVFVFIYTPIICICINLAHINL